MEDIDQIIKEVETSSNNEIPMSEPPQQEAQTPEEKIQEFEFIANNQNIKVPFTDERLKRWAQMGYEAPNKFQNYNKQLKDYENKFKDYENKYKPYMEVDEWAKKNPDQWKSLEQKWREAQLTGTQNTNAPVAQLPPQVLNELQESKQFREQLNQEKQQERVERADRSLDSEITDTRKQNPQIDFNAVDHTGKSLEYRVLEHATQNGIPSFRAAFRDLQHEQLLKFAEERGRGGASLSQTTKNGLLGKPTPGKGQNAPDLRGKSIDQIHQMILHDMGLSG